MATRAARRAGGTTKLVPWTTSRGPTNASTGGTSVWAQATRSGRAGMARCAVDTPAGTSASMPRRRRQLTAKARTESSGRRSRPLSAPAQKAPTPVGRPSNAVASRATARGRPAASSPVCGGDGTRRALHTPPGPRTPRRPQAATPPSIDKMAPVT